MTYIPVGGDACELDLLRRATFITADAARGAVLELRGAVALDAPAAAVARARIFATAHGVYELAVGGVPAGEELLSPGWTAYEQRLTYQAWDVTEAVRTFAASAPGDAGTPGSAMLEVVARLGNGWWRGDLGFASANASYGEELGLLAALEIVYDDGRVQVAATGPGWTASTCDVVGNNLYQGERIDARLRTTGGTPLIVREAAFDADRLAPQVAEPIRRQETFAPRRIWTSPSGRTLVDFGQNLVGWVRVTAAGPAGSEITLRHGEVLEHGELGTRPLRGAAAMDTFVLSGQGTDVFEPTFTFHGFRYVEVTGWPGELTPDALTAVVIRNDLRATSTFASSEPLLDQLVHNVVWGQKGNFLAIPTDCPQRDERLGWTGDIAAFASTAAFQYDVADFLHSWLLDVALETAVEGFVPVVVPDVLRHARNDGAPPFPKLGAQAIWSDAAVWVPQALWNAYGDLDRLAAHYPGMVAHLESVEPLLTPDGLWGEGMQLADWLDPDAPPDAPWAAKADPHVVATAAFFRSAAFAARAARHLGRDDDGARWDALAARVRAGFRSAYVTTSDETVRITSDCVTVYALAICFDLLEEPELAPAADRLAGLVGARGHRITTGFAGTPFVTWALSEHGHADDAYRLLMQTQCPSWLYPVTMGATTVWERWDSMLPDGTINPGEMTSFNHYALGAVADWVYQVIGGIRPAEPGYRRVLIQPVPGPGLTWASVRYESRAGRIQARWSVDGDVFRLETTVPDGLPTDVVLPDGTRHEVSGGHHVFTSAFGLRAGGEVGPGSAA